MNLIKQISISINNRTGLNYKFYIRGEMMQGRLENKIKREKTILRILSDMPDYVCEYYYNFSSSRESTSCLEYIRKIRRFLLFLNSDMESINISKIDETHISKFLKSIEIKNINGESELASFSTWKQYHSVLNSFFKYLCNKGYIEKNPVDHVERVKKNDKVKHEFLSKKDLKDILDAVEYGAGNERSVNRQKNGKKEIERLCLHLLLPGCVKQHYVK